MNEIKNYIITNIAWIGPLIFALIVTPLGFLLKNTFFKERKDSGLNINQKQIGGAFSKNIQIGNIDKSKK